MLEFTRQNRAQIILGLRFMLEQGHDRCAECVIVYFRVTLVFVCHAFSLDNDI
jgi:hypothetical protein